MILTSIIIPLAPLEKIDESLNQTLERIEEQEPVEILWMRTKGGQTSTRAKLMNSGAKQAQGQYLWFLHADSQITPQTYIRLKQSLTQNQNALVYFDLEFKANHNLTSRLMRINQWGVKIRCQLFKLPFGDQALGLAKSTFDFLGGYSEKVKYGEDHLLVWEAKKRRIEILSTGYPILTSARKYENQGWLRTTLLHQCLFIQQASIQFVQLLIFRMKNRVKR